MKKLSIFVSLIILIFTTRLLGTNYENKRYPVFSIGDTLVYSKIEYDSTEGTTTSNVNERLLDIEIKSGEPVEKWEIIESQTSPTIETKRLWEWRNKSGEVILQDFLYDDGEGGVAVISTVQGSVTENPSIGSVILNRTEIGSVTVNLGGDLYSGYGGASINGNLHSVSNLVTNLGPIVCYKMNTNQKVNVVLYSQSRNQIIMQGEETGYKWHSNKYGLVKEETSRTVQMNYMNETSSWTESTTLVLISAQVANSTKNEIETVGETDYSTFDGWNWSKWPWVYNNSINNWLFYYPISAGLYSVYNNQDGKWYLWSGSNKKWVSSN
jgi:hypothetical protein